MSTALVLFHSNLRLGDHAALAAAAQENSNILPLFVLDDDCGRPLGGAARWWLHHSLARLDESLRAVGSRLLLRRGSTREAVAAVASETGATKLYLQRGYDPAVQRIESELADRAGHKGHDLVAFDGQLLFPPENVRTRQGKPYTVFSPFWRACLAGRAPGPLIPPPEKLTLPDRLSASLPLDALELLPSGCDWTRGLAASFTPGETAALETLDRFLADGLAGYKEQRDRPDMTEGTSRLSASLRFGEISPRTVWHRVQAAMAADPALSRGGEHYLRQLGWRDFSYHLLHHFPHLPEKPLRPAFAAFPWRTGDAQALSAWQKGMTGFPIVDAGMRQLWQTGWMHNRVRMIAASFLVKELLLHWREGEAWFWDTLVDADPANNAASWQWVAGSGADAAPYFRIFNPVLQGEKFDPDGAYIRQFVPELADLPGKYIQRPWEAPDAVLSSAGIVPGETYPHPLVDRKMARERALAAFQTIKARK